MFRLPLKGGRKSFMRGSLGSSDDEIIEFCIEVRRSGTARKIITMDFRRATFNLIRDLFGRISWEQALWGIGVQKGGLIFKNHSLQSWEECITMRKKLGQWGKRSLCMN